MFLMHAIEEIRKSLDCQLVLCVFNIRIELSWELFSTVAVPVSESHVSLVQVCFQGGGVGDALLAHIGPLLTRFFPDDCQRLAAFPKYWNTPCPLVLKLR